ncbi:MAG TPA: HAMP domain-containing sensor histidine kinase, partial [Streptosporangiaceae bacterium]|nr:HAMP domain-containing sensor histidine kinase [Streptosporangiaceae bacterium]
MTWLLRGSVWRLLVPLAAGAALSASLQAAEPAARLYAMVSPSLLAGLAGLLGTGVLAVVVVMRRRAVIAAAAAVQQATAAAVQQAAAAATQDRLRFLMRLDHELKNPLTAMRAGLANIEQAGAAAGSWAAHGRSAALASVSAQADRITRLVSDLRKLADLETQEIETVPVDLPGLLYEVAEAAAGIPGARERVLRLSVPQAPWPLPHIEGDRDLLFIAIQNLISNAVKFSVPGDTVEVRASEDDHGLLLEVADTGTGIPADEIGQVWQELARGRAARSLPGTGIGLALVRVVVTRHGGRVAIRSREGQGTVVSIRLPARPLLHRQPVKPLEELVRGELDLLVPPLSRPVHAGDDAHPVDAPEVPVYEGVPGLGLVGGPLGQAEVPAGVLFPGVPLQVGVLVARAG